MFCGKCGAQLEDDAKFCPACGAVIEQNTASEKQKPSGSGIAKIMKSPSRMIGVAAVVLFFYKLDKQYAGIMEELEKRESRGEL